MIDRLDMTVVAISSAPAAASVGIVRLSGAASYPIADRMTTIESGVALSRQPASSRVVGEVQIDDDVSVPAAFYIFRAPHSYTREDLVEIHTIGSPALLELVRRRAVFLGATEAEPGEFTARAFLHGAMDLGAAEAVAGVIRAQSDTQLRAARRMMDGSLAEQIVGMRAELAELVALVEADIDFSEEPIEFITPDNCRKRLDRIMEKIQGLLAGSKSIERLDVLPRVLLLGPPNAGKSTLMNRLTGTDRAICAAVAGTTRDILTAPIALGRTEAILLDSAGVDQSEDEIIAQARTMALSTAERVDLLCLVVDVAGPDDTHFFDLIHEVDRPAVLVAVNKCDLASDPTIRSALSRMSTHGLGPVCAISALSGTGIDQLKETMTDLLGVVTTTTLSESMLLSVRQERALEEALHAIVRAVHLARAADQTIDCADVLAFELRDALDNLGIVSGEVTTEDLLAEVFANFCIGK